MTATITAATGETITLVADQYDAMPDNETEAERNSDEPLLRYSDHPRKIGSSVIVAAKYGHKYLDLSHGCTFTVESGMRTLSLVLVVGNCYHTIARIEQKLADGSTRTVAQVGADYPRTAITVEGIP